MLPIYNYSVTIKLVTETQVLFEEIEQEAEHL